MVQSVSERYKIIYEAWLTNKSSRKTAKQFGISGPRVVQIVNMYRKQLANHQAMQSTVDDPLRVAVELGKMPPSILISLVRGGYGNNFNFEELVNRLRTNTLNPAEFQKFGPKSLKTLRELFLSQAENDALPALRPPSSTKWWLDWKNKSEEIPAQVLDEKKHGPVQPEEVIISKLNAFTPELEAKLVEFAQSLVRTKSLSGQEGEIIRLIERKMKALGYDEVTMDAMGNILGKIGHGEKTILLDSHVDTVEVEDEADWEIPPFNGAVIAGRLHGRGSVDMKSGVAASIYAGAIAKKLGLVSGKTIYVSCSVNEEDCDGENLKHLFKELQLKPDYVVICEPSNNKIVLGQKGKAQISIRTHSVSTHGSAPEKGRNAIYEMAEIIQQVEKINLELMKKDGPPKGTLVMSRISSTSVSLNAIPSECEVYLDRRMVPGEKKEDIQAEVEQLVKGKSATWEVGTLHRKSWTGLEIQYEPFHLAWKIDPEHQLVQACLAAYIEKFGHAPAEYDFWDFSTNAVTPVKMGIPTIGFGPGEYKLAHMRNESCEIKQIVEACAFYASVIDKL